MTQTSKHLMKKERRKWERINNLNFLDNFYNLKEFKNKEKKQTKKNRRKQIVR